MTGPYWANPTYPILWQGLWRLWVTTHLLLRWSSKQIIQLNTTLQCGHPGDVCSSFIDHLILSYKLRKKQASPRANELSDSKLQQNQLLSLISLKSPCLMTTLRVLFLQVKPCLTARSLRSPDFWERPSICRSDHFRRKPCVASDSLPSTAKYSIHENTMEKPPCVWALTHGESSCIFLVGE